MIINEEKQNYGKLVHTSGSHRTHHNYPRRVDGYDRLLDMSRRTDRTAANLGAVYACEYPYRGSNQYTYTAYYAKKENE